jgi:2'-hydroxyisoflavone reductase
MMSPSASLLSNAVNHYTYISSFSVYADFPHSPNIDETYPVHTVVESEAQGVNWQNLALLKALCEDLLEKEMPSRALIVRSGLIVGPNDPTDRFTYWPYRVAKGGEVLAPGSPNSPVQIIDVRDLAEWILSMVEARKIGIYNAGGQPSSLTMQTLLEACQAVSQSDTYFTWVSEAFLQENGIGLKMELPLWIPSAPGAALVNCNKAISDGLKFRPLLETIRDTLIWDTTRSMNTKRRAGLSQVQETALLRDWSDRKRKFAVNML